MPGPRTFLIVTFAVVFAQGAAHWSYSDQAAWGRQYPFCGGKRQSPIDIQTAMVRIDPQLGHFTHSIFQTIPSMMNIKNNGHSVEVSFGSDSYTIDDHTLLPGQYKLAQFHFHWGTNAHTLGSEHGVNGQRFFGEMHLVHYNVRYNSLKRAMTKQDGLAVLGFFLEARRGAHNHAFETLLGKLTGSVRLKGGERKIAECFPIDSLLPRDIATYYRYRGSLTTPPCYETVIWSVFAESIKISHYQADRLANALHSGTTYSSGKMGGNFREFQSLNGRTITKPSPNH